MDQHQHTLKVVWGAPDLVAGVGVEAPVVCRLLLMEDTPTDFLGPEEIPLCLEEVPAMVRGRCLLSRVDGGLRTAAMADGRTNMPNPGSHVKYRTPFTSPSFLPVASVNSMPTHCPSENSVVPRKRMVASRPSVTVMTVPT